MSNILSLNTRCPIDISVHLLGNKWTVPILRELFAGPKRPSQLYRSLRGISSKTLTQRLRELEDWQLVKREVFEGYPRRTEYSLTETGKNFQPLMVQLRIFGSYWLAQVECKPYEEFGDVCSHCLEQNPELRCPAVPDLAHGQHRNQD